MKTSTLLQTTGLTILLMVLTTLYANAQIPYMGMHNNHEGVIIWNADGTGPEPAAYGHQHPFGWGSTGYYGASRDYDNIDPDPDAALAHFLDNINGFPLFVQALTDHGFTPAQVKLKSGLMNEDNDLEGEDWFTFDNHHYFNKYDAYLDIELNGEPMISAYTSYYFLSYDEAVYGIWQSESNFMWPVNASSNSSLAVQAVADAFMQDMAGEQLRGVITDMQSTGVFFWGNGRVDGVYFNIVSGYLEKGHPELPLIGLATDNQGLAAWDADGTGPEPAQQGHTVIYNGTSYMMTYYIASVDYEGINSNPDAALCHIADVGKGFPNLTTQMAYRGYTPEDLRVKSGLSILGNDTEGVDWGLEGPIHWWRHYGTPVTIEIAGEPIFEYMIDTNYSYRDLNDPTLSWTSSTSFSPVTDISGGASADARYVANSFLRDIGDQYMGSYMEGNGYDLFSGNGRTGVLHQVNDGYLTLGSRNYGTTVEAGVVSGTWEAANSPYMIEGNIEVLNGTTLTMGAGVKVAFRGPYHVEVNGRVKAEGTPAEQIVFTHSNPQVFWDGFDFPNTASTNDSSLFDHCLFEYGYAQGEEPFNSGGAVTIANFDKLKFTNCIFQFNFADQSGTTYLPTGGAIALWNSDPLIQNCIFRYNFALEAAGAILVYEYSAPVISGCLFYGNKTTFWAGAIGYYLHGGGILLNSTIADNNADFAGALGFFDDSSPEIINTILWGNTAGSEGNQVYINMKNCTPGFYYCDIQDGSAGFGGVAFTGDYLFNIPDDPLFAGSGDYPYALSDESPCMDAGTSDTSAWYYPQYLPNVCLCGNPRISGSCIDMGCYESLAIGMNEYVNKNVFSVNVVPNPVSALSTIEFYLEEANSVRMTLTDIHGRVVYEMETSLLPPGKNYLELDAEKLTTGIYVCRLQQGNKAGITKVIKLKE